MLTFEKQVPDSPTFYYRSTALTEKEFNQDIIQTWVELLKHIREHRPDGSWNRIFFECWCSQGFMVIYPAKAGRIA